MNLIKKRIPYFTPALHQNLILVLIFLSMLQRMHVTSLVRSTSTIGPVVDPNRNWFIRLKHKNSFRSMTSTSYNGGHKQQQQKKMMMKKKVSFSKLEDPQIIFSNNHVLVVNKPPGWHSVPNESFSYTSTKIKSTNNKCLLQYLKRKSLGGGSQSDFLLPMHRLDQPCSGCILYAKTSKAATRITTAWKQGKVIKEYWCIVQGDLQTMIQRSTPNTSFTSSSLPYTISGLWMIAAPHKPSTTSRSVQIHSIPLSSVADASFNADTTSLPPNTRLCQIHWGPLQTLRTSSSTTHTRTSNSASDTRHKKEELSTLEVICVQTNTGAKHQIRAMLSYLLQSPIVGDYRYGYNQQSKGSSIVTGANRCSASMLPDQSVALHARSLLIPTSLGNTTLPLFVAPIPTIWANTFGLHDRIRNDTIPL